MQTILYFIFMLSEAKTLHGGIMSTRQKIVLGEGEGKVGRVKGIERGGTHPIILSSLHFPETNCLGSPRPPSSDVRCLSSMAFVDWTDPNETHSPPPIPVRGVPYTTSTNNPRPYVHKIYVKWNLLVRAPV